MAIPQRNITDIVIHCTDTPNGRHQTVGDIDSWHRQRGFHRVPHWRLNKSFNSELTSIGYHFVIYIDGSVHTGRHIDEIGAHVAGHNSNSVGVCMVGTDRFTLAQWVSLRALIQQLQADTLASAHRMAARVRGHRDFDTAQQQGKTCPNFDVGSWLANPLPPVEHVFPTSEAAA